MKLRSIAFSLVSAALAATAFAPDADAAGFTRRSDDPNNPFYDIIDEFQQFSNTEASALDPAEIGARQLDPTQLTLTTDFAVEVFFINEGAGYRNQLGVTSTGTTEFSQLLFEDITCTTDCAFTGYRSPELAFGTPDGNPLEIGDYYDLGTVQAGSTLDFFINSDGYQNPNATTLYAEADRNVDGLQHALAYEYQGYLVLAFEDIVGGGDLDYNDVVFALNVGSENLSSFASAGVPEPKTVAGVVLSLAFFGVRRYWKQR